MVAIERRIADELGVRSEQVQAAIALLDEGATVPFIARYRKEVTGNLTDDHLRTLHERLAFWREMEARRESILNTIREQGKLTPELEAALLAADTKTRLEDLYLPYRPKRRSKAATAREAGLQPLADLLLTRPSDTLESLAAPFIHPEAGVADGAAALEGAREILMDQFADDGDLVGTLRQELWQEGILRSTVVKGKEEEGSKFADYFDFAEPLKKLPSHRVLALLRGKEEGILRLAMEHGGDGALAKDQLSSGEGRMAAWFKIHPGPRPVDGWLLETVRQTWRKKLRSHLENDLTRQLTEMAHGEAIRVFASNLKNLLLAAPAGTVAVMGLDPGLRTGVKIAVVNATGRVVETATIYPHPPRNLWQPALEQLALLAKRHKVRLISIGNGTASRETDKLVQELCKKHPELGLVGVVVSEAGASVYSASEYASKELPDLDVSLRGAVSIARRLQDPLAELVKIDPKAIGVGQYQHDVDEKRLAVTLDGVVEDAVNGVGVDVNIASVPLLERVSGLNTTLAKNIVIHRHEHGPFRNRKEL
ncbi:MAG: helix-hairpin-helix domain-containing protein, partial [Magnetococcales bacterium]|nr:helix-hairpin-helix domain-containing protein [Magnetococcales bacterium]